MNFLKNITLVRFVTETFENWYHKFFKVKMDLAPEIMKEVFEIVEGPYALRNELKLKSRKIYCVGCGILVASFVGAIRCGVFMVSFLALESGTVYPVTLI